MIYDPDYARVFTMARCIAWNYGYAAVLHGSFTRDLDILLVPWTDAARGNNDQLIALIAEAADLQLNGHPATNKPHGRKAYTLLFKGWGDPRFVDIGVMPPITGADYAIKGSA